MDLIQEQEQKLALEQNQVFAERFGQEKLVASLQRLVELAATSDTGGANVAAQVVLSLYNGSDYPMDLTELCRLDEDLFEDVMNVIRLRIESQTEPHEFFSKSPRTGISSPNQPHHRSQIMSEPENRDLIASPEDRILTRQEFRVITRSHVLAWRKQLEGRELAAATIRRKLSAISALFEYLCENNAIERNPTHGVKRPSEGSYEGKKPALGDNEAKALLTAPPEDPPKEIRDRAILATYLFHGLRAAELANLTLGDIQSREGAPHLRVFGKRSKIRYVPFHPAAQRLVEEYLEQAGRWEERGGPTLRTLSNNRDEDNPAPLSQSSLYRDVIKKWSLVAGLDLGGVSNHAMRATAATNALSNVADIAKVQE